jgi:eukaryotic-like serine/threonine-protein kinase
MHSTATAAGVGHEIGKYHLIAELARGGMGRVYLAIAQGPGGFHKLLVVKELRPELATDATFVAMFLEEARLAARLTHPNIVQTYEVGSDGGRHYMVMEYLDGRSLHCLSKHLVQNDGFPVGAHLRVIAEALRGLHYAHELTGFDGEALGIVHRDVSPLNLLLTFDGQAKLLDFGIAKAIDSSLETQAGVLKGRIAYMAPEHARGERCDRRVDVYAAGVMIWEAAAGRRLWQGMSNLEILTRIASGGPPRLRAANPSAPFELDELCGRAMSFRAADRHPTAGALLADLEAHLGRRDDAVSMLEIGALASAAFEQERRKMNAVIDDVIAHLCRSPRSGVVPTLALRPLGAAHDSGSSERASELANISSFLAATPSLALSHEPSVRFVSAIRRSRPAIPGDRRSGSWWKRSLAGAVFTGGLALGVAVIHSGRHAQTPPIPASSAVATTSVPPAELRPVDRSPVLPTAAPVPVGRGTTNAPTPMPHWSPPPRWTIPAPQTPHTLKYDHVEASRTSFGLPDASPEAIDQGHAEVDPGGGRVPRRPIVTTSPYGAQ